MKVMVLVLTRGVAFSMHSRERIHRVVLKPDLHFVLEGFLTSRSLTNARRRKKEGEVRKQFCAVVGVSSLSMSLSIRFIYSVSRSRAICQPRKK